MLHFITISPLPTSEYGLPQKQKKQYGKPGQSRHRGKFAHYVVLVAKALANIRTNGHKLSFKLTKVIVIEMKNV